MRTGSKRTPEQTDIARFWATVGYYRLARSVTGQPGRDVTRNARFLAVFAQTGGDAIDAVFDANDHFQFWRPFTAIRNGDQDGNDATERAFPGCPSSRHRCTPVRRSFSVRSVTASAHMAHASRHRARATRVPSSGQRARKRRDAPAAFMPHRWPAALPQSIRATACRQAGPSASAGC